MPGVIRDEGARVEKVGGHVGSRARAVTQRVRRGTEVTRGDTQVQVARLLRIIHQQVRRARGDLPIPAVISARLKARVIEHAGAEGPMLVLRDMRELRTNVAGLKERIQDPLLMRQVRRIPHHLIREGFLHFAHGQTRAPRGGQWKRKRKVGHLPKLGVQKLQIVVLHRPQVSDLVMLADVTPQNEPHRTRFPGRILNAELPLRIRILNELGEVTERDQTGDQGKAGRLQGDPLLEVPRQIRQQAPERLRHRAWADQLAFLRRLVRIIGQRVRCLRPQGDDGGQQQAGSKAAFHEISRLGLQYNSPRRPRSLSFTFSRLS